MGFSEQSRNAGCDRSARQHRDKFALAAGPVALPTGLLHRVGGVKHHGTAGVAHDHQAAHIGNERVVAEAHPALAHHDLVVAHRTGLVHHILHVPGSKKLALLDVDRLALARHILDEVGLPAQERRRLQHIHHRCNLFQRRVLMNIGQYRHADLLLHFGKDAQSFVHAQAAKAFRR